MYTHIHGGLHIDGLVFLNWGGGGGGVDPTPSQLVKKVCSLSGSDILRGKREKGDSREIRRRRVARTTLKV